MWKIYCDGAYSSKADCGGIGIVFIKNEELVYTYSKAYKNTTNNKMELIAVITALNSFAKEVNEITIYTDSMYVFGCATLNWKRSKNIELWRKFDEIYTKTSKLTKNGIKWIHVKGHQKDDSIDTKYNNLADKLAVEAVLTY